MRMGRKLIIVSLLCKLSFNFESVALFWKDLSAADIKSLGLSAIIYSVIEETNRLRTSMQTLDVKRPSKDLSIIIFLAS